MAYVSVLMHDYAVQIFRDAIGLKISGHVSTIVIQLRCVHVFMCAMFRLIRVSVDAGIAASAVLKGRAVCIARFTQVSIADSLCHCTC